MGAPTLNDSSQNISVKNEKKRSKIQRCLSAISMGKFRTGGFFVNNNLYYSSSIGGFLTVMALVFMIYIAVITIGPIVNRENYILKFTQIPIEESDSDILNMTLYHMLFTMKPQLNAITIGEECESVTLTAEFFNDEKQINLTGPYQFLKPVYEQISYDCYFDPLSHPQFLIDFQKIKHERALVKSRTDTDVYYLTLRFRITGQFLARISMNYQASQVYEYGIFNQLKIIRADFQMHNSFVSYLSLMKVYNSEDIIYFHNRQFQQQTGVSVIDDFQQTLEIKNLCILAIQWTYTLEYQKQEVSSLPQV
eukprot:403356440